MEVWVLRPGKNHESLLSSYDQFSFAQHSWTLYKEKKLRCFTKAVCGFIFSDIVQF